MAALLLLPSKGRRTGRGYETYGRLLEARLPDQFLISLALEVVHAGPVPVRIWAGIYDCEEVVGSRSFWVVVVWGTQDMMV